MSSEKISLAEREQDLADAEKRYEDAVKNPGSFNWNVTEAWRLRWCARVALEEARTQTKEIS